MRKVKYVTHGFFGGKNKNAPGSLKDGWFHGVFQEGNNEVGIGPVVVVESLIGELKSVCVDQVKFVLQPGEIEANNAQMRKELCE